ncbi:hypothetical protein [Longispora urticae]
MRAVVARPRTAGNAAGLMALQRSAGNAAVAAYVAQREPLDAGAPAGAPAAPAPTPAPAPRNAGPTMGVPDTPQATISEGPIGEVVLDVPDWNLVPAGAASKLWELSTGDIPLATLGIPKLGVRVGLDGKATAKAGVTGAYRAGIRNIQLGMRSKKVAEAAGMFDWLLGPAAAANRVRSKAAEGVAAILAVPQMFATDNEFRMIGNLDLSGSLALTFQLEGSLKAAAKAAGLEIAAIGAGLTASTGASTELRVNDRVGMYYHGGRLHLRSHADRSLNFNLFFDLRAFLEATLLGYKWRRDWELVRKNLDYRIPLSATVDVGYNSAGAGDGPAATTINITQGLATLQDLLGKLFSAATSPEDQLNLLPGGGGAGGPGAPGAPGGTAGAAPTGRTKNDPIPMDWHKPPGLYPMSITLGENRYFLTEPDWLVVPNTPGLSDVRRSAMRRDNGEHVIKIGVSTGSKFFPSINSVWPRVRVGAVRGGVVQDQFRALLRAYGYDWGTHEADHVRDLQWAGSDAYPNLWPLERSHNQAANEVLKQQVTYQDAAGQVHTVPLEQTPLNLYFQIRRWV